MIYTLSGAISGGVAANLRIEAWDASGICPDLIDVASTDARGSFAMKLDADYLEALLPQQTPTLAFRIFNNGKPVTPAKPVVWEVTTQATRLQIPLAATDDPSLAKLAPAPSVVRGTVTNGDGSPAANRVVHAFDRNLAATGFADTPLGQATTAADGQYELRYATPVGGKLKPDLIVRVDGAAPVGAVPLPPVNVIPQPPGTTLPGSPAPPAATPPAAESSLMANAPTVAMVDLSLDGIIAALVSEHRTLIAPVAAIAATGKLALADLTDQHIAYVADSTGLQAERVTTMVRAAQIARQAGN